MVVFIVLFILLRVFSVDSIYAVFVIYSFHCALKGELQRTMNLWSNKTLVHSQPFSKICFHDNRM